MATLVFIDRQDDELSRQAVAFAERQFGGEVQGVAIEGGDYAPPSWARALADAVAERAPDALVGPGTDRGNELLAHVAAITDLPMAANCVSVTPGSPASVIRMRWGGSLLEE